MTDMFKIRDHRDIDNLAKFLTKASAGTGKLLISKTLTEQAKAQKKHQQRVLGRHLQIRNPNFLKNSIYAKYAKKFGDPNTNYAEAGSIERDRFSGWEENQTGQPSKTNRVPTQAARVGGAWTGTMRGKARMRNLSQYRRPSQYKSRFIKTKTQSAFFMLKETRKQRLNFILRRGDLGGGKLSKFEPGLYGWRGKNLMRLQTFGKRHTPKRIDWNGKALKITQREADFFDVFGNEFIRMARARGIRLV